MDELHAFMDRHRKVVLQFSAGKDSAACLKLLRPYLDKVEVLWCNPGNPYPETVEYMLRIKSEVPHFRVVCGDQPWFIDTHGYPADSVPFESTPLGRIASGWQGPKITSIDHCCGWNLWRPLRNGLRTSGATGCIRGEKRCDPLHSSMRQGESDDHGTEFFFPLDAWSDSQVVEYLGEDLPPSYRRGLVSSLDCINCTAYLHHDPDRFADLRTRHPDAWGEVQPVLHWLRDTTRRHLNALEHSHGTVRST